MKVEVRAKEFDKAINGLRGNATASFDGCFAVHNISIVERKDGNLFVSMPSYKTKQVDEEGRDVYKDICFPVTKEFREHLYNAVLTSYKEHKPVIIDTNNKGRDHVVSDAELAAREDMGELPFDIGESGNAGSPEAKTSVKEELAGKMKESKETTKAAINKKGKEKESR